MTILADINIFTAHPALRWKTPYEKRHAVTPDISRLLVHHFYEPYGIFLCRHLSQSPEKSGYFLFPNKNVGDALTFSVLDDTTLGKLSPQALSRKGTCASVMVFWKIRCYLSFLSEEKCSSCK
jgi:hypothetical protein